ncbi:2-phospho-L-lactate guanylyltransferase [Candidatus Neomicrothrix sp.]|uniref:2-phospho-L-lactate guanylyltransferase n=1 Tax=Candidatus Neomicrothrix sp. TaxID=2719034 RepID=UPI002579C740|nr:2-phospho-L-lactate guanylyltransferase [Candidatus Microthrix sp.]MBK9558233.1 2-phospho-L-lactate guanylyltransferase [Candidatus Microthrix sp.]HMS46701.1 2-phospho-L-lactate guanylyltransferase [Candidatus Microthrix sp.]
MTSPHVRTDETLVNLHAQDRVSSDMVVLIPVKSFATAKARLGPVLGPDERAALARGMAARVIEAAAPAAVWVVCDDEEVAGFARLHRADVCWTPGLGLNGALAEALSRAERAGASQAVIAHADLPFAADLPSLVRPGRAVLVPDRHRDGTNVMCLPTSVGFRPAYGPRSYARHRAEARRLGLGVDSIDVPTLAWDVDRSDDLWPPQELGAWPPELPRPTATPTPTPTPTPEVRP